MDKGGNLFGTASIGGNRNCGGILGCGTVFELDPTGKESVLYIFNEQYSLPLGLVMDGKGNLYGVTNGGGEFGNGAVYTLKVSPNSTRKVLYSFSGGADGSLPLGLVQDNSGNLYGVTFEGGAYGRGTVFKVDLHGTETVLYSFSGGADGDAPHSTLLLDGAGNLYGTTEGGGLFRNGTVFKIDSAGKESVLYSFSGGADGECPSGGGVVADAEGNLYGTTALGGDVGCSCGVVYKLDTDGNQHVLYTFTGGADGKYPKAVILDSAGNLFGTTFAGGTTQDGTVFEVDASGKETVLYSFTGGADGSFPVVGLLRDTKGNLYGTTYFGGTYGVGTVFKIVP
jgi:uncharacterized repeat protein (TIGR03803 family)